MPGPSPTTFDSFGELLKYLRRRAGLTQRELGIAVGYSDAQIARLENGTRQPDPLAVKTVFIEALGIEGEPDLLKCLINLAAEVHDSHRHPPVVINVEPSRHRLTNLSAQLTHFVGRERELAELLRLLANQRLVTLTGAAGMGKTRLALEAGQAALGHFEDGVWLVEFAPLADSALLPQVLASVFRIPDQPGRSPMDALMTFLAEKRILLILDNCEHLIEACAHLVEVLLRACPQLHILGTSREALRILGEATWRVPPLDVPDMAHPPPFEQIAGFDAVQMFIQHAALDQPGFTPTADNLAAIARICQRLDGMPLAIEMAATQVADLGIGGVAAGLDNRFDLLTSGSRTALPHHQTLRATLDWSYNLLSETERQLLAYLSVFSGGWTVEAATSVCGPDSLPLLLQLVRKSLVATTPQDVKGETRYRLLETVRQYADETLRVRVGEEVEALRDRHLAYFLGVAEAERKDIGGRNFQNWVRRIDLEYDNLRAALAWADTRDDQGETELRLASAVGHYWHYRSHISEGIGWFDKALARGGNAPAYARARALVRKAGLRMMQGDLTSAIGMAEASLALFRQTDDGIGMAWCLEFLANNMYDARAQTLAEEALPLFRELGSQDGEARVLRALAAGALRSGDHAGAAQYLEQAFAAGLEVEDGWQIYDCLLRLSDLNPERALELSARELARLREVGNDAQLAWTLQAYGFLLLSEGQYERALAALEESAQWQQGAGAAYYIAQYSFTTLTALGFVELSLGHLNQAISWLGKSRKMSREAGMIGFVHGAQFYLATALAAQGKLSLAADDTRECLRGFHKHNAGPAVVCSLIQMADLARRRGDMQRASKLLGTARVNSHMLDRTNPDAGHIMRRWHHVAQSTIVQPTLTAARAQLGDAEFEAAYAEGQRMTLDEAVQCALAAE